MKITAAERELVLRERERLALDSCDWNREAFVTYVQLLKMSPWRRELFSPMIWRPDYLAQILRNTAHPDNANWANRELLLEALKGIGSGVPLW